MRTTNAGTSRPQGRVRVEPGAKRVRAYLGGAVVVDTTRPVLVWEDRPYPTYYVPLADVRAELVEPGGGASDSPGHDHGTTFTVRAGSAEAPRAAYRDPGSPIAELRDLVRLDWGSMDAWFEEDEEVFTHPRDPYTRLDILPSSRHVRVDVDGVTVAESTSPRLLFETGLPTRYYLPKTHVRLDLLTPSARVSHCPYKGQAEYWSVRVGDAVHEDLAWSYRAPVPESQRIAGLIAFYNEKVDVSVDGVLEERPRTTFA